MGSRRWKIYHQLCNLRHFQSRSRRLRHRQRWLWIDARSSRRNQIQILKNKNYGLAWIERKSNRYRLLEKSRRSRKIALSLDEYLLVLRR